ncbi:hypothetical protein Tco_0052584 [Tanacetum coccineum]
MLLRPKLKVFWKSDCENYVKETLLVLKNVQNQGQTLQNLMANVRVWLDKFCNNSTIFSLLRYLGTLPKSNRKLHCEAKINAITHKDAVTSRFGKDLRILLLLHPLFSTPSKEPIQNRGDVNGQKCKKPSSEKNIPAQVYLQSTLGLGALKPTEWTLELPKKPTPKVIVKSPVPIKGCVLGLENVQTWDSIVKKFRVRKPESCADKAKGKKVSSGS